MKRTLLVSYKEIPCLNESINNGGRLGLLAQKSFMLIFVYLTHGIILTIIHMEIYNESSIIIISASYTRSGNIET